MAEIKNQEETTLPIKRKSDLHSRDTENFPKKSQKVKTLDINNSSADDEDGKPKECGAQPEKNNASLVPNENSRSPSENNNEYHQNDDDGDEDDEELNGKSEVDRKGKGIMLGDKGKGKMINEDEDEDEEDDNEDDSEEEDDSSDDGEVSNDDSDLSDDPLTEVSLDNILPSRTRRRTFRPDVYISNDLANDADNEDDDDREE